MKWKECDDLDAIDEPDGDGIKNGVESYIYTNPGGFSAGRLPVLSVNDYSAELETYARSLSATYQQEKVPFLYAQPSSSLVFDARPKSLKEIATKIADYVK